jgi:cephalosporin-C deacetylase
VPSIDLPLAELERYAPEPAIPPDFDQYWAEVASELETVAPAIQRRPAPEPLRGFVAEELRFRGLGGLELAGWSLRPAGEGPFPGVAVFHGYGGRGARPLELLAYAASGLAAVSLDCRGQGGDSPGDGPPSGHVAGWLTQGLLSPARYYYRAVYADALRTLAVLAELPGVDPTRLATTGASQGGGLALAVAALSGRVCACFAEIPFLCDIRRGVEIAPRPPYSEIAAFLRQHPDRATEAFATLAYIDGLALAPRIHCPTVVTVGLLDDICPPSTAYGTFRRLAASDKELRVAPWQGHEVTYDDQRARLAWLVSQLRP